MKHLFALAILGIVLSGNVFGQETQPEFIKRDVAPKTQQTPKRLTDASQELTDFQTSIEAENIAIQDVKYAGLPEEEAIKEIKIHEDKITQYKKDYCAFANKNITTISREEHLLLERYSKDIK